MTERGHTAWLAQHERQMALLRCCADLQDVPGCDIADALAAAPDINALGLLALGRIACSRYQVSYLLVSDPAQPHRLHVGCMGVRYVAAGDTLAAACLDALRHIGKWPTL
jgi:hypothetical protein